MSHHKCDGSTEEFTEMEYNPYDSICGERFSDRFVLKKSSLMTEYPQEYNFTGNIGMIGHFNEVASPVKAPLGKKTSLRKTIPLGRLK